jgi:hypothetical protein
VEKKLSSTIAEIQAAHPQAALELWSQDEARLGLFTTLRRMWAPRGKRPIARVQPRRIWAYVSAFVHPASGRSHLWVWSGVNIAMMTAMLECFATLSGAGVHKRIVLVVDQAGWHTSPKLVVPEGVHIVYLPSHTPELQPTERLWPYMREAVANDAPVDRAALQQRLEQRCVWVANNQDVMQAATHFHWWPER